MFIHRENTQPPADQPSRREYIPPPVNPPDVELKIFQQAYEGLRELGRQHVNLVVNDDETYQRALIMARPSLQRIESLLTYDNKPKGFALSAEQTRELTEARTWLKKFLNGLNERQRQLTQKKSRPS